MLQCAQRMTGLQRPQAQALLGRFPSSPAGRTHEKPVSVLSGGERRRLALAGRRRLGCELPRPRRADEPPRPREPRGARGRARRVPRERFCSSLHDRALLDAVAHRRSRSRTRGSAPTTAAGRTTCAGATSRRRRPWSRSSRRARRGRRSRDPSGRHPDRRASSTGSRPRSPGGRRDRGARAATRGRTGATSTCSRRTGLPATSSEAPVPLGEALRGDGRRRRPAVSGSGRPGQPVSPSVATTASAITRSGRPETWLALRNRARRPPPTGLPSSSAGPSRARSPCGRRGPRRGTPPPRGAPTAPRAAPAPSGSPAGRPTRGTATR